MTLLEPGPIPLQNIMRVPTPTKNLSDSGAIYYLWVLPPSLVTTSDRSALAPDNSFKMFLNLYAGSHFFAILFSIACFEAALIFSSTLGSRLFDPTVSTHFSNALLALFIYQIVMTMRVSHESTKTVSPRS